jgi:hypothetical protein
LLKGLSAKFKRKSLDLQNATRPEQTPTDHFLLGKLKEGSC